MPFVVYYHDVPSQSAITIWWGSCKSSDPIKRALSTTYMCANPKLFCTDHRYENEHRVISALETGLKKYHIFGQVYSKKDIKDIDNIILRSMGDEFYSLVDEPHVDDPDMLCAPVENAEVKSSLYKQCSSVTTKRKRDTSHSTSHSTDQSKRQRSHKYQVECYPELILMEDANGIACEYFHTKESKAHYTRAECAAYIKQGFKTKKTPIWSSSGPKATAVVEWAESFVPSVHIDS
jgi:hypothetical protein